MRLISAVPTLDNRRSRPIFSNALHNRLLHNHRLRLPTDWWMPEKNRTTTHHGVRDNYDVKKTGAQHAISFQPRTPLLEPRTGICLRALRSPSFENIQVRLFRICSRRRFCSSNIQRKKKSLVRFLVFLELQSLEIAPIAGVDLISFLQRVLLRTRHF